MRVQKRLIGWVGALLVGWVFFGCEAAEDAKEKVQDAVNTALTVSGKVTDTNGNAVEGARVKVYLFTENLNAFSKPDQPVDIGDVSPDALANYAVQVHLGYLLENGKVAKSGTTGADGKYKIEDLPINELIVVAEKTGYSTDIAGMDAEDGTISLSSALGIDDVDKDTLTATIVANFALAGGPIPGVPDTGGPADDVDPVEPPEPPAPPEPPEPPVPPEPACTANGDCDEGMICRDGDCAPECLEAADCAVLDARMICSAESRCVFECDSDSACADEQICNAEMLACEDDACNEDADCDVGVCSEDPLHGRCVPGCEDDENCADRNMICNVEAQRCEFECVGNADCEGDTPLCQDNHCVAAECGDDDACVAEGAAGGYCVEMICIAECEDDAPCADRNMVCNTDTKRCELECVDNAGCEGETPLCLNNRCVEPQCADDDACMAEDGPGGFCVAFQCVDQCTEETAAEACEHEHAWCERGRCHLPDPNDLYGPETSVWPAFIIQDIDGNELANASTESGLIDINHALVADGGPIRIVGRHADTSVGLAWLRVQNGSSRCEESDLPPKIDHVPITLTDGAIMSDVGDFQPWFLSGGFEQYQLDLDQELGNGNESYLISVDDRCEPPAHPMTVTLTWDTDRTDVDLHVWNAENDEHTFYASTYVSGDTAEKGASAYGIIDVDDRDGYGPEVFTLRQGQAGSFLIRAHFFSGPRANATTLQVRVVRFVNGQWIDETFSAAIPWREWVDIGVFPVDAE